MAEGCALPLQARGLGVRFGALTALRGIDLTIDRPLRLVVLGANGAGKSVLLRALHGLIAPTEGSVTWGDGGARARSQAMVFQRPVMLRRSAQANIEFALAVRGMDKARRIDRARSALERVGLAHLARRQARVLSGGEQQRLALARAWALQPAVLFLDEPTANVDPRAAAEVEHVMNQIHAGGSAVVLTTHHLGLARRFADEIVFLHEGRMVERAPAADFFHSPASREAREFLEGELPWSAAPGAPPPA